MKPKHHIPFILLNIPLLLLSPTAHAQDQDKIERKTEAVEVEKSEQDKADAILAKKTAEKEKEAAKLAKETARLAEAAAKKADNEAKKLAKETARLAEKAEKEAAKETTESAEATAKLAKETAAREKEAAAKLAKETAAREKEAAAKLDKETAALEKEAAAKRAKETAAIEKETSEKKELPKPTPDKRERPTKPEIVEVPVTEPERLAESKVTEVTREVQLDLDKRKTRIESRKDAQSVINEILGSESRISRAEVDREERFRPRIERQYQDEKRATKASVEQRRAATTYYQERLRGREVEEPLPEFFRQSSYHDDSRDPQIEGRVIERIEYERPRYLNDGRRYVHYDSRSSIPAILMAALAMNQVRFQPTREIAPTFYDRREDSVHYAMPLPPENYRGENSWVVSYPVDEKSMISSEDILFLQGSTQFSDPYSYEVVSVMADAMKAMPEEERFVIEGHASAEGSYESNMILSQQRAEFIVREIVRQGVSPYRLLPVGYGESEARRAENAAEALRSQDRRVVVFRMKPEAIAQR